MLKILLNGMLVALISIPIWATEISSFPQLEGHREFKTTDRMNYTGQCGSSIIKLNKTDREISNSFTFQEGGEIRISNKHQPDLVLPESPELSKLFIIDSFNLIACVKFNNKFRILITSHCGGSLCGDNFEHFYIINPETLQFLAPKNPNKSLCNEECAAKLVGKEVIQLINK